LCALKVTSAQPTTWVGVVRVKVTSAQPTAWVGVVRGQVKGASMAKTTTMDDLLLDQLRDLYDAEKQLTKALSKMAKAATSEELKAAFEEHQQQTEGHVERLEQIFEQLGEKSTGKKCAAMNGLIKEGEEMASDIEDDSVRDAGLIAAAQKVEHYEISGYGSVRTHAQMLGHGKAVRLLQQTLDEEKETDQKLNDLAESMINEQALHSAESESEESESMASGSSSRRTAARSTAGKSRSAAGTTRTTH
jgi:ferritin-like metal-binding protein YciE